MHFELDLTKEVWYKIKFRDFIILVNYLDFFFLQIMKVKYILEPTIKSRVQKTTQYLTSKLL